MAVSGGMSGALVAAALMRLLGRLLPKDMATNMPFLDGVNLNLHSTTFACAIVLGTALLSCRDFDGAALTCGAGRSTFAISENDTTSVTINTSL